MPLADGDPAEGHDVWHRIITAEDHWKKDGSGLHSRAFGGKRAIAPPEGKPRPWNHELSGRLYSLVQDIDAESKGFCERFKRPFEGIMFQTAAALRTTIDQRLPTNVCYTPIEGEDNTHADFVIFNSQLEPDIQAVRVWLAKNVRAVRPNNLQPVRDAYIVPK